jgi:hypothetical protein
MTRGVPSKAPTHRRAITGLATVALLKTNYDEGRDHISMFMPFVLDAVASLERDDFDVEDVRNVLFARHRLSVPDATLRTLLQRAVKQGAVKREFRRYFRQPGALHHADITSARDRVEGEHGQLAGALRAFAEGKGRAIADDEEALALLLGFLADNEIAMLLDEAAPDEGARHEALTARDTRLIARFINDVCLPDRQLAACLGRMLEGLVLQNALLLRDIATAPRRFGDLCVYLDTGFLLRALGFEGEAAQVATREGLDLLRETNARFAVFDKTVDEIKRILGLYEHTLGTARGRESLRPTAVTRHFLTERYAESDVRQARALVERQLSQLGIEVRLLPAHDRRYTRNEADLTRRLQAPGCADTDPIEPRVQHDVDCVAAVLTSRGVRTPDSLDHARAIFATTSAGVVQTVNAWWRASGEVGLSPIIHYIVLSNAAWLKKPGAATDLKLRELVALCTAALRPSPTAWQRFLRHLRKLEDSGELSSDEAVAVVASGLTDRLLSEVEEDDGLDASTLNEVVERVKATYRADADKRIAEVEAGAASEAERRRRVELKVSGIADSSARWLARLVFVPVFVLIVVGSFTGVPLAFPGLGSLTKVVTWAAALLVSLLTVFLLYHDPVKGWHQSLETRLRRALRARLLGEPHA